MLKRFAKNVKSLKEQGLSGLSARIKSTNKDRDNSKARRKMGWLE